MFFGMTMSKKIQDEEAVEMITEAFAEDGRVRTDYLQVESHDGKPVLSGRVGSDEELQVIDEIMTDVLDIDRYENHVWVDDTLAFDNADDEDADDDDLDLEEDEEDGDEDPFDESSDEE